MCVGQSSCFHIILYSGLASVIDHVDIYVKHILTKIFNLASSMAGQHNFVADQ